MQWSPSRRCPRDCQVSLCECVLHSIARDHRRRLLTRSKSTSTADFAGRTLSLHRWSPQRHQYRHRSWSRCRCWCRYFLLITTWLRLPLPVARSLCDSGKTTQKLPHAVRVRRSHARKTEKGKISLCTFLRTHPNGTRSYIRGGSYSRTARQGEERGKESGKGEEVGAKVRQVCVCYSSRQRRAPFSKLRCPDPGPAAPRRAYVLTPREVTDDRGPQTSRTRITRVTPTF